MDNLVAWICAIVILWATFTAGRFWQKLIVALRLVKIVHDDAAWEADCKDVRDLIWEIRVYLQMLPWWRD